MPVPRLHLLLIAAIALLLALPGTASAGKMHNCGGGVRAAKVSCAKAKRIATEYAKTRSRSLQGYTCRSGGSHGRCVLDRKIVTFRL